MKIGEKAPNFVLKDLDGKDWDLSDYLGKTVVLLFYPADNSPVCTAQLCSVRDNWSDYQATGAEVVGISTDSVSSHKDFSEKNSLTLPLLADEKGEVTEQYGVKSWIPNRSSRAVVVIDKEGIIRYHKVQTLSIFRPNDDDILQAIKEING
ncbi:MAG: peroxiredoxin [Acidobacteriota bacterium]